MSSNYRSDSFNPLPLEPDWSRRNRMLTQALIVSGAINIALLATFAYFVLHEKETAISFEKAPIESTALIEHLSNEHILKNFSEMSFPELIALLENTDILEDGYRKRDLALGCLVAFHFFNLEKALGTSAVQKRAISFINQEGQEKIDVAVYPGLSDEQFQAVVSYAKTERWPITPEGLFFELKQDKNQLDPGLIEAFCMTEEFHAFATLFVRSGLSIPKEALLQLIAQGDWTTLSQFVQEQKTAQDLSPNRLKTLLLSYLKKRSLLAAKILLEWDREFVVKRLEDSDLALLMEIHLDRSLPFETALKEILIGPRTDAIHKKAAEKLYGLTGLAMPDPYDHAIAVKQFAPQTAAPIAAAPIAQTKKIAAPRRYIVQKGDNLWAIAKKHKISVDELKQINQLQTDTLKPGKELEIPSKTPS